MSITIEEARRKLEQLEQVENDPEIQLGCHRRRHYGSNYSRVNRRNYGN